MKSFGPKENIGGHTFASSAYARTDQVVATANFFAKVLVDKGKLA